MIFDMGKNPKRADFNGGIDEAMPGSIPQFVAQQARTALDGCIILTESFPCDVFFDKDGDLSIRYSPGEWGEIASRAVVLKNIGSA